MQRKAATALALWATASSLRLTPGMSSVPNCLGRFLCISKTRPRTAAIWKRGGPAKREPCPAGASRTSTPQHHGSVARIAKDQHASRNSRRNRPHSIHHHRVAGRTALTRTRGRRMPSRAHPSWTECRLLSVRTNRPAANRMTNAITIWATTSRCWVRRRGPPQTTESAAVAPSACQFSSACSAKFACPLENRNVSHRTPQTANKTATLRRATGGAGCPNRRRPGSQTTRAVVGAHRRSFLSTPENSGGAMPITVKCTFSTSIGCPIAFDGPPKRLWFAEKLMTATGAAPGWSSSEPIRRPAAGDALHPGARGLPAGS